MCGSNAVRSVAAPVAGLFGGSSGSRPRLSEGTAGSLLGVQSGNEAPGGPIRFQPMQDARRMIERHSSILSREQDRRGSTVMTSGLGQVDIRRKSLLGVTS